MKKSLIALAVLAASGAAMAQSSVQIYGDMDLGIAKEKITNPSTGAVLTDKTGVDQGLISGGNIGFKGTEDLGGGLKAIFKVETDFAPDAPGATKLGNKYAYVGLAGGFGEVQLGTVGTAYDDVYANSHSALDSDFAATYYVFQNGMFGGSANNGIKYVTPSFGGFSGAVTYAFGENKVANNTDAGINSADSAFTIGGQYENGPIYLAAAYGSMTDKAVFGDLDSDPTTPDVLVAIDGKATGFNLNGSYDFGVAKLKGTYANGKFKVADSPAGAFEEKYSEYEIAVDVPVTAALTLSAGYAKSQDKLDGVKTDKRTGYSLSAFYALSKRTMVYAGYNTASEKNSAGVKTGKATLYAVGVQHKF